jgi:IS30 family transposase
MRLELGVKPGAIAVGLGRPASPIRRELRRNGWFGDRYATTRGELRKEVIGWPHIVHNERCPRARGKAMAGSDKGDGRHP